MLIRIVEIAFTALSVDLLALVPIVVGAFRLNNGFDRSMIILILPNDSSLRKPSRPRPLPRVGGTLLFLFSILITEASGARGRPQDLIAADY